MDPTISVSKGCFVFKNGATRADKNTKKSPNRKRPATKSGVSVLDKEITDQPFYATYTEIWQQLETHIEKLQKESYARTLSDLVDYVAKECADNATTELCDLEEILPTAALLTGINQPDHLNQFETFSQHLHEQMSASVCVLQSRDCPTLKAAVEAMVYNFIEAPFEEPEEEDRDHKRLRRTQCTMKQLKAWYRSNFNVNGANSEINGDKNANSDKKPHALVIILPDFECFSPSVLQDFILILSANYGVLPFVLILGVATSVSAVHNTLPYQVSSKIKLRVFQTNAAPVGLNEILEQVLLSPKYAFHLSGKAFKFLTHIFLYYDFSIQGFIQGFKYCLMEHYFQGNAYVLCNSYAKSLIKIKALTHDDMECIRRQLSFRPYVERMDDCKRIISILTDDDYLKKKLPQLLRDCHLHFMQFRCFLEFLTVLVSDLPKYPLGKLRRELYSFFLAKDAISQPEFKECWQMLSFMSKDEFVNKMEQAMQTTEVFIANEILQLELGSFCAEVVRTQLQAVKNLLRNVVDACQAATEKTSEKHTPPEDQMVLKPVTSRHELKAHLLQMSKQDKSPASEFGKAIHAVLDYIEQHIVNVHLVPLQRAPPLHELFVFADIANVRRNLIGAPRAALHTALNNPHFYLQCKCCELQEQSQLVSTLPDLSVIYKLHLECGRMINLFDWLQAFRAVVDFNEDCDEEQEQIDPKIQARFTRAVAELQFLGYIKMSKRKADHVSRLTW